MNGFELIYMDMDLKSLRFLSDCVEHLFFDFENMTFLEIFDMYFMIVYINSQYLVRFSQYLVKIHQLNVCRNEDADECAVIFIVGAGG